MDFLCGMVGDGFVLLASDSHQARSVVQMKFDLDKMIQLSSKVGMLMSGPVGDCSHFGEYIQKNLKLNSLRDGHEASPHAAAHYTRLQLSQALRSKGAYQVNLLIGGYDEADGPALYFMDHLAAFAKVPYAAHGYGGYFTLSTMDRYFKPDMTLDEAKAVMVTVLKEVQKRFIMNMTNFNIRVVDKNGITSVDLDM